MHTANIPAAEHADLIVRFNRVQHSLQIRSSLALSVIYQE
jgi:hypothetical protein